MAISYMMARLGLEHATERLYITGFININDELSGNLIHTR